MLDTGTSVRGREDGEGHPTMTKVLAMLFLVFREIVQEVEDAAGSQPAEGKAAGMMKTA